MSDDATFHDNGLPISNEVGDKVFTQQNVNDILKNRLAREEAVSARKEAELTRKFEEEVAKLKSSIPNEEQIAARVHADLDTKYRHQAEEQQQAMYAEKYKKDKEVFKDLADKVDLDKSLDKNNFLSVDNKKYVPLQIAFANLPIENKTDIMRELAKRPGDLFIANLAASNGEIDTLKSIFDDMSEKIKNNKEAVASRSKSYEPISHIKPSSGGSSNGKKTLDDYRKTVRY